MKVAIVHDWLTSYAGAEKVLAEIINCFPNADLYAVVDFLKDSDRKKLGNKTAITSFIQKFPFSKKKYRTYLPFMPLAIEQLDLSDYQLIISSSHAVAKGVITGPDQIHISYVHSPIRYAWDMQHQYLRESGLTHGIKGFLAKYILHKMRIWDQRTANGVDYFIANSKYISRRIWKVYRRDSDVIYPPVDISNFVLKEEKENFYLTASRMVPYKRIDLIVEAFAEMPDKNLIVIGDGPEMKKIRKKIKNNITLLGYQNFEILRDYMQRAKAFVFAAEEDFGIVPVEAQACGTPVIAYGKGGVLETVRGLEVDNPTGLFYKSQTISSLCEAVVEFEKNHDKYNAAECRKNAANFSIESFRTKFNSYVNTIINKSK